MPVLTPETEARLISVATSVGKTPDEVVQALLRDLPTAALSESELLRRIQEAIPPSLRQEREVLITAQKARAWSASERARFLELTNQIETCEADRILLLSALARQRGITLPEIARQLELMPA
ncbi:hypothetical protein [Armatimonas sp.]|uniref:hypothetical protein n=1 Tax=Armatimonas sp. TaxID=1872638 RepID=UPI00286A8A3F|nr:hypothetical protein [Armatimonas sp.]